MKKAIFLHAWFQKPTDNWYPWLNLQLEKKGYQTYFVDMPTMRADKPQMTVALKQILKEIKPDKETTIIGHSLGNLLAMRLAEQYSFKKLIMVCAWDFDDLKAEHRSFWKTPINHTKIKRNVKEIFVVHSDNDPYVTVAVAEEVAGRFGAKFILIKRAGHFIKSDGITKIPELLKII